MRLVRQTVSSAGAAAALLASVVGFITDVLQPLGDFAPWVAGISLVAALISGAYFVRLRRKPSVDALETPAFGIFALSAFLTVVFTVWSVISAGSPERGYLASASAPIAQLQAQLLGLQADVKDIKETTQKSATAVAGSATTQAAVATQVTQGQDAAQRAATQAAAAATAQAQGFADIQAAFAKLASQGTLAPNPQAPQEWYANARLYQLKGDTANAIKAYEGYFTFRLEYVDPYNEYIALLKTTEGAARTRQIIDDMRRGRPDSLTLELIQIRLLDAAPERLQRLAALAARAPQFAPAFLDLGQEYDRALQGNPTSDMIQKQQAAYGALFRLEEQQGFSRYNIDKSAADKTLSEARRAQAAYAAVGKALGKVEVQVYYFYNGVQFAVVLPEAFSARQLLFSVDDPDPKNDAGRVGSGAQTFVNTLIGPIPLPVGDHTFYVKYVDANGVNSPVTSQALRVEPIAVNFQQQPQDFATNTFPGIFSIGIVGAQLTDQYRYAYSIDSDRLDQSLDGIGFSTISVTGLTRGDHTLSVRATAADGKQTPVVKVAFSVK